MPLPIFHICLNYFTTHIGFFSIMPILTIYLINIKGFSVTDSALMVSIFTVAYKSARFFVGPLLDNINPKTSIVFGCMLSGICLSLIGLVNSFFMIVILLILSGFGFSARGLAGSTSVSFIGDQDGKGILYFGNINVFVNIASMIGPFIGTYLYTSGNSDFIFPIIGGFYIVSGIHIYLFLKSIDVSEKNNSKTTFFSGYKTALKNKPFMLFLIINLFGAFLYGQLFTTFPFYVSKKYGQEELLGLLYLINGLLVVVLQIPISNMLHKFFPKKEEYYLVSAYFIFGISFLFASIDIGLYFLYIAIAFFSIAEIFFTPTVSSIVSKHVTNNLRTTYFSLIGLSTAFGEGLGAFAGLKLLYLFDQVAKANYYWVVITLFAFFSSIIVLLYKIRESYTNSKEGISEDIS
ncbi:MFS transporter [Lysinibacillus macroides]|nr:MFS transporter [Lysinibacillus macroides]